MKSTLLVCCALIYVAAAESPVFSYSSCDDQSSATITKFVVTPDPISIPGKVSWELDAELNKHVTSASMSLKLVRKSFLLDITLPCYDHIGSCEYDEICSFVEDMVREDWAGIGKKVGDQLMQSGSTTGSGELCTTGIGPIKISKKRTVEIPELPSVLSFIADGEYEIQLKITDNSDQSTIICVKASMELKDGSSLWGKRKRRSS